jgi:type I restriction enzyme, S subunit
MSLSRSLSGCQVFHPSELPAEWDCVHLKDRLELLYGRALKEEVRKPGDVDVYGSNGKVGSHNEHWLDAPGVLVGRKGTVGAVHYTTKPFWPIDTTYYVKAKDDDELRYLFYLLDYLPLKLLNAATGVPGLSRRDAYALLGAFPPPREQAAIARVLDVVDSAIDQARQAHQRSLGVERSLIAEAFDSMNFRKRKLGEFAAEVRYGTSKASSQRGWGDPVLRIPNVLGDQLSLGDLAYVDLRAADVAKLELRDGDLLLVRTNGNPNYVGRSAVFRRPDDRTWVYASYLIRVRLTGELLPEYVNVFLGSERGRRELLRRVTTSAGNHNINSNSIRLLSIPVPQDFDQQRAIADLADASRQVSVALKARLDALSALKKSLMRDLLTGTVRVDPASFSNHEHE